MSAQAPTMHSRSPGASPVVVLLLMALGLVTSGALRPAHAQAPANPAAEAPAIQWPAEASPWEQLQALAALAPSRHPSQPGNEALARFIQTYFAQAVASEVPAAQRADLERMERELATLDEQVVQARLATLLPAPEGEEPAALVEALDQATRAAYRKHLEIARQARGQWLSGRVTFPLAVFEPGPATLTLGGRQAALHQLTPNLIEPANLPEEGFQGPLVYIGRGQEEELAGKELAGAAVLMEFNSERRWLRAVELGAKVIVLLEPPAGQAAGYQQAIQKFSLSPLSVPRFYLPRQEAQALLGEGFESTLAGQPAAATITQPRPGRWVNDEGSVDWLYIPPAGGSSAQAQAALTEDPSRQAVHVQVYLDANSVVPALAPGGMSLGNVVALLRLVDEYRQSAPSRPVILSVVNGHTSAMLGEQEFGTALFAAPEALWKEIDFHERAWGRQTYIHERYDRPLTEDLIKELRAGRTREVAEEQLKIKDSITDFLRAQRNLLQIERETLALQLDRLDDQASAESRLPESEKAQRREAINAQLEGLDERYVKLTRLMNLFNTFASFQTDYADLDDQERETMSGYLGRVSESARVRAQAKLADRQRVLNNLTLRGRLALVVNPALEAIDPAALARQEIFKLRYPNLEVFLSLNLDLSFGTGRLGVFPFGYQVIADELTPAKDLDSRGRRRVERLAIYALTLADQIAQAQPQVHAGRFVDTLRNVGGVPMEAHLGMPIAMGSRVAHQFNQPGLTLTNVRDGRFLEFTPHDTIDRLDQQKVVELLDFVEQFVPALLAGEYLAHARVSKEATPDPVTVHLGVRERDAFSVVLPKTPLADALVLAWSAGYQADKSPMKGQVRPYPILVSGPSGDVMFRGAIWRASSALAYKYSPDYRQLQAALDGGISAKNAPPAFNILASDNFIDQNVVAFRCVKVDLVGLSEPLNLMPAQSVSVIEGKSESTPKHFAAAGIAGSGSLVPGPLANDGTGSLLLEPGTRFVLRLGRGLLLNADPEAPLGRGFTADGPLMLDNLVLQSANDLQVLSTQRLDILKSKGVVNATASEFSDQARQGVEQAQAAQSQESYGEALEAAEKARGLAFHAYQRSLSTINDLVKAAVIFLALVIPFCFFAMKLVSPYDDITKQMALFGAIFALVAAALWFLHPAFKVTETPTMVIIAFVMIGLAAFVSGILLSRFNASMTHAIEEAQQSESTEASQGRLAGVAFMVGVNNMKRRRIRTSLTCATIVLVTFTMLSVISVSQDIDPARVRLAVATPYTGFLVTRPGLDPIGPNQVQRLRSHFEDRAQVVARSWNTREDKFGANTSYELENADGTGSRVESKVLYGLEVAEDGLLAPMPLRAGRWFSSNQAAEIVLSVQAAALMGITPENFYGRRVGLLGHELELVGLLSDEEVAALEDMDGVPFLPLVLLPQQNYKAQSETESLATQAAGTTDLSGGGNLLGAGRARVARPDEVAFLPLHFARSLPDSNYRTLSVKYPVAEPGQAGAVSQQAWRDANELIQWQHLRLAVGISAPVAPREGARPLEPGQYALASSSSTKVSGMLKVGIPIVLAATIIFNTMLGSVMERRREVGIYNAIGLNPGHVMMFFLAESFVFGMVGAVAGYIIGQALSLVVTALPFIQLNLNYSSTSVLVVILLTIVTVLLSTVYPAMMAARAAVPSGQRRWSLPQPDGDHIQVHFPFSYDANRVVGVCAYLREFMHLNTEASTGKFLAALGPVGKVPAEEQAAEADDAGDPTAYCMVFDIAPAPFDLGVNQSMEVYAYYNPRVKAHMLSVHLTRMTGEHGNWVTVNQPFLEALRKRLLGWRSQKAEIQNAFYEQGRKLFAQAPMLPTRPTRDAGA